MKIRTQIAFLASLVAFQLVATHAVRAAELKSGIVASIPVTTKRTLIKFPDNVSIGTFEAHDKSAEVNTPGVRHIFVKGSVELPAGYWYGLRVSPVLVQKPELFDYIPADILIELNCGKMAEIPNFANFVQHLSKFKNLRSIDMNGCEISDDDISKLRIFSNLENLAIWETNMRGDCIKNLVGLKKLKQLNVSNNSLKPETFKYLGQLTSLNRLVITRTYVTDSALREISNLKELDSLKMRGGVISAKGLAYLRGLKKLQVLDLVDCDLASRDLAVLKGLKLISIDLPKSCSPKEYTMLKATFPDAAIHVPKAKHEEYNSLFAPLR